MCIPLGVGDRLLCRDTKQRTRAGEPDEDSAQGRVKESRIYISARETHEH